MLMKKPPVHLDQAPQQAPRIPFANEMDLHRFVEKHAKTILNLEVIASAQRGGGRLFDIDILAVDKNGRPFIIECKWDLVDQGVMERLRGYGDALRSGWADFQKRLNKAKRASTVTEPVLVAIGYRYDQIFLSSDLPVVCLAYTYPNLKLTSEVFQEQKPGRVNLQFATEAVSPTARHPQVSKRLGTDARLRRLAPGLRQSFWTLDKQIKTLDGVTVRYGKLARYKWPNGLTAKALIERGFIHWTVRYSKRVKLGTLDYVSDMRTPSDATKVFAILRDACH